MGIFKLLISSWQAAEVAFLWHSCRWHPLKSCSKTCWCCLSQCSVELFPLCSIGKQVFVLSEDKTFCLKDPGLHLTRSYFCVLLLLLLLLLCFVLAFPPYPPSLWSNFSVFPRHLLILTSRSVLGRHLVCGFSVASLSHQDIFGCYVFRLSGGDMRSKDF